MPVAINGTITNAATTTAWINMVSGTVYHILFPILIDGSTTSPNMSRGTVPPASCVPLPAAVKTADYPNAQKHCQRQVLAGEGWPLSSIRHRFDDSAPAKIQGASNEGGRDPVALREP
jgi:hypothetical protein